MSCFADKVLENSIQGTANALRTEDSVVWIGLSAIFLVYLPNANTNQIQENRLLDQD